MRTLQSKICLFLRFFMIFIVFIEGCATAIKGPPPAPIRKYSAVGPAPLYDLVADVFREDGYDIMLHTPDQGYFETTWKIERVPRTWRTDFFRRRKYEVTIVRDFSKPDVLHLHLKPKVEEKSIKPYSHWKIPDQSKLKNILYGPEYVEFLNKIGEAVEKKGGEIYRGD
jgi:hypothetical protein